MDFKSIYLNFSPKIFKICLGYFNDVDKAKDLTQETFIAVYESFDDLKNHENISGWIYRIATNKCLRQLQTERKNVSLETYDFLKIEEDKPLFKESDFHALHHCIAQLPEVDRIIIGLHLEEVGQEKIAEIVGISHANVRVRIHRIKAFLIKKMRSNVGRL